MIIDAVFDGSVFIPDQQVDLEPDTQWEIVIREKTPQVSQTTGLWNLLESLAGTIEGPEDWSVEHDHYLYDTQKRSEKKTS
jgi:predicted DNA-binding antitoxin AbrB/MazE fold protein